MACNAVVDRLRALQILARFSDEVAEREPLNAEPVAPIDGRSKCVARTLGELPPGTDAILRACNLDGQMQIALAQAHGLGG